MADWVLAANGESVFKIDPLKQVCFMNPKVTAVEPMDSYILRLTFENNDVRVFDVSPFLEKGIFQWLRQRITAF